MSDMHMVFNFFYFFFIYILDWYRSINELFSHNKGLIEFHFICIIM